ncbi:MAG TPA: gamma-glutamylcyclotransferase family protein [Usitatibacter sp.]|nr:gamma-glutamylcyclotransferase family protein [Usitatibacter sp.]
MAERPLPLLALLALALAACAAEAPRIAAAPRDCHPQADPSRPQLIVGYGSLMEDESRRRTSPRAGPAHPVEIAGYERGWFARGTSIGFSTTYLGARAEPRGRMNAVAYEVDAAELGATDRRESSYCRASLAPDAIHALERDFPTGARAQAWIYVTDPARVELPDARFPIAQSYVDVFLSGCLEQEERFALPGFARECIATTAGWSRAWVNDRIYPRRPFVHQPRAGRIDRLLSEQVPDAFAAIRIEGGTR